MRYMIVVRATDRSEAGVLPAPDDPLMAEMEAFHQELARAGVLLDAAGLKPSREGWRLRYREGCPQVIDGPFAETKELIAGYTLIQVRSREEALEWSRRFPNPVREGAEAIVEVRELYEMEDFTPSESLEKFKAIDAMHKL